MSEPRRTPLYSLHKARGGRLVEFAGYEMPVQYGGVVAEHTAVRTAAGLFDVSHMGEVVVTGARAIEAVQHAITNDLKKLADGQALYTAMCVESGGIVDDLIVYREGPERIFICVNASRRADDFAHMQKVMQPFGVRVEDLSDAWAQIAFQGPKALGILQGLTKIPVSTMKPFTFADGTVAGKSGVRVARTGYTGEDGVELYCRPEDAVALWEALEQAGSGQGILPCGLGARDTLRLEMKYMLYGNDIDLEHNPYEAGLGWVVKLDKGEFVGRAALAQVKQQGPARRLVGFKMTDRGIPRHGYPVHKDGAAVGVVTSGTHSPSLGEPIGLAYVPAALSEPGSTFEVIIRDKPVGARVVKTPFYQRKS